MTCIRYFARVIKLVFIYTAAGESIQDITLDADVGTRIAAEPNSSCTNRLEVENAGVLFICKDETFKGIDLKPILVATSVKYHN